MENLNIYKYAAKNGLRFVSNRGRLTVEDLFRLPLEELDTTYRSLKKLERDRAEVSLLSDSDEDEGLKISIQIVEDVYKTRKADADAATEAAKTAQKKKRIAELIAEKEDAGLRDMSIEDLKKLLDES